MRLTPRHGIMGIAAALAMAAGTAPSVAAAGDKLTFVADLSQLDHEAWTTLAHNYTEQSGVDVDLLELNWSDYPTKLSTMLAGGVVPDVAFYSARYVSSLMADGAFTELSALRKSLPNASEIFPAGFDEVTLDGKLYGIPSDINFSVLYFNAALFDDAGLVHPSALWQQHAWTWDAYAQAAKRLTRDVNGDGRIDQAGISPVGHWAGDWPTWFWTNGASILTPDKHAAAADSPQGVETLQFLADLINTQAVTSKGLGLSPAKGQVGMWVGGANNLVNYRAQYPFTWDLVGFPVGPSGSQSAATLFGGGYMIFKQSKHPDEALDFVRYLLSPEADAIRARLASRMPIRRGGLHDFVQALNQPGRPPEHLALLNEIAPLAKPLPITPVWDQMEPIWWDEVDPALAGKRSAQEALHGFAQRVAPIMSAW